ncbi:MAG: response regulator transcription factor [Raoultibacter sp.]
MNQENKTIRVIVVDDDPFVRMSLTTILSAHADIEVCADGGDGTEAIVLFDEHSPDVLLMDIQMPGTTGLAAAESILAKHPDASIVFLTTFADDEYIISALRMGAKGYLIKQEVANIAPAIRSVVAGQSVLGGEILGRVDSLVHGTDPDEKQEAAQTALDRKTAALHAGLSEREFEIIELVAQGLDNKEISEIVYIGEGTVRNHVSALLQKLSFKNRTQLAALYYRNFQR